MFNNSHSLWADVCQNYSPAQTPTVPSKFFKKKRWQSWFKVWPSDARCQRHHEDVDQIYQDLPNSKIETKIQKSVNFALYAIF